MNIAECCLLPGHLPKKTEERVAIVWRNEGFDEDPVNYLSYKELRNQVMYVPFKLLGFTIIVMSQ